MPDRTRPAEDGGYELLAHRSCMSEFFEVALVNGERCYFGLVRMANDPDQHLHLTEGEARRCAQDRLAMGITMPGPEAARA